MNRIATKIFSQRYCKQQVDVLRLHQPHHHQRQFQNQIIKFSNTMKLMNRNDRTSLSTSNDNNTKPTKEPTKPLAVLAGWLGCHPKSLRRYQELYESLGWQTIVVIASPIAVIDATIRLYVDDSEENNEDEKECDDDVNSPSSSRNQNGELATMEDLAWKVLCDVQQSLSDHPSTDQFTFHVFSNGGCFLWESVCRLFDKATSMKINERDGPEELEGGKRRWRRPRNESRLLKTDLDLEDVAMLSTKCCGVVFDSCPAWFASEPFKLWMALQAMQIQQDQLDLLVKRFGGEQRLRTLDEITKRRNEQYFDYLKGRNSSSTPSTTATTMTTIPQLYLYSMDDPLTDYKQVQSIIDNNKRKSGMIVFDKCWIKSSHCGHLKDHPNEYRSAVVEFLHFVRKQSKL